mmetsp:Transcript_45872/g.121176  ORF Transcript_45872/g.121176 Transcript_45872/m.121176 type:complete len:236 (+) Transcript_45872:374-1081(+)
MRRPPPRRTSPQRPLPRQARKRAPPRSCLGCWARAARAASSRSPPAPACSARTSTATMMRGMGSTSRGWARRVFHAPRWVLTASHTTAGSTSTPGTCTSRFGAVAPVPQASSLTTWWISGKVSLPWSLSSLPLASRRRTARRPSCRTGPWCCRLLTAPSPCSSVPRSRARPSATASSTCFARRTAVSWPLAAGARPRQRPPPARGRRQAQAPAATRTAPPTAASSRTTCATGMAR